MEQSLPRRPFDQFRNTPQLAAGLLLIAVWWPLAWGEFGSISHYYFFPLWLGYVLSVDGLVWLRRGTSPLVRLGWSYPLVFVISAPFWWMFEFLNRTLTNWSYITPWDYGLVGRTIIGSFSFATVIPAVLTTAELLWTFIGSDRGGVRLRLGRNGLIGAHIAGWLMLISMMIWPEYLFPFCWLSVLFILDPIARALGATTISTLFERGRTGPLLSLAAAGLVCGWFWEMWNYLAMPKWIYSVPHVGFLHVWEMPILGYGGYIPFAFEIFAFYVLVVAALPWLGLEPDPKSGRPQIDPVEGRFL
ncbi:MAG: hypothetical protein R3A46_15680 [Thermomicrobiales bacterium]